MWECLMVNGTIIVGMSNGKWYHSCGMFNGERYHICNDSNRNFFPDLWECPIDDGNIIWAIPIKNGTYIFDNVQFENSTILVRMSNLVVTRQPPLLPQYINLNISVNWQYRGQCQEPVYKESVIVAFLKKNANL